MIVESLDKNIGAAVDGAVRTIVHILIHNDFAPIYLINRAL
jgi:hypothetical protein